MKTFAEGKVNLCYSNVIKYLIENKIYFYYIYNNTNRYRYCAITYNSINDRFYLKILDNSPIYNKIFSIGHLMYIEYDYEINRQIQEIHNGSDLWCITAEPPEFLKDEYPVEINSIVADLLFSNNYNEMLLGILMLKKIYKKK